MKWDLECVRVSICVVCIFFFFGGEGCSGEVLFQGCWERASGKILLGAFFPVAHAVNFQPLWKVGKILLFIHNFINYEGMQHNPGALRGESLEGLPGGNLYLYKTGQYLIQKHGRAQSLDFVPEHSLETQSCLNPCSKEPEQCALERWQRQRDGEMERGQI